MAAALRYVLDILFTLYSAVLLLRLLLQVVRADFRNPLARAIVQLTNPVVLPLRKVLPPVGKVDTASLVAVVLCTLLKLWLLLALAGVPAPAPGRLLAATVLDVLDLVLITYLISMFLNALLSFVAPGNYSPAQALLASICNPVLNPIRRVIPPLGGLDLSPLWACIAIQALRIILRQYIG
ncbi:MAG: YggT family protein [Pseudomonadota bacterium]|nr:YggT family protein [Pseudomonadota bacterium]